MKNVWLVASGGLVFIIILFGALIYLNKGPVSPRPTPDIQVSYHSNGCGLHADEIAKETGPLQSKLNDVNGQLNALGQKLSVYVPTGQEPISSLDIATQHAPGLVPTINDLTKQSVNLSDQISAIKQKYNCQE